MNAPAEMSTPLIFTDSAANKVKELILEEGNPELKLRVFVTGGGCSGFQYGFTFDEVANEDDTVVCHGHGGSSATPKHERCRHLRRKAISLIPSPCMLVLRKIFQTWFQPRRLWAKGGAVDKSRGYSTYPRQATRFAGGIWPANCPQPPRPPVAGWQLDQPWGDRARGRARSAIPFSLFEPERLLGPVSPHFARMGHDREHL
jgi:hypothetical protein